jgi:hypothetical protein
VRTEAAWGTSRTHEPARLLALEVVFSEAGKEQTYFNGGTFQTKTIFGCQELLYIFALITLKLNHLTHLRTVDDGAIAGFGDLVSKGRDGGEMSKHTELLLDDLEDLLLVEFLGYSLNSCQGLTTISL